MKVRRKHCTEPNITIGQLVGGTCFRLPAGEQLYIRVSGATQRVGTPSTIKLGVALKDGQVYNYSEDKVVVPADMEAVEL